MNSSASKIYLAVDLGATSGRVMAGFVSDETGKLVLEEMHRFPTTSIREGNSLFWDIRDIFSSIKTGLKIAAERFGERIQSVGVDSWAVDYGLIDEEGELLGNPHHYRDSRTDGMRAAVLEQVANERLWKETGIQYLFFNTIYQLYAEVRSDPTRLSAAKRLLFIPDLINYWLTGKALQERTVASTSQLLNPITGAWSETLLEALELPTELFAPVIEPGSVVADLMPEVVEETGIRSASVVTIAGHDTASAFVALPGDGDDFAIMSSGTWSLIGLELDSPQLSENAMEDGFSNEVGYAGTVRFLKNICGMWLIEQCLGAWKKAGRAYDYAEALEMAESASPFGSLIDPDAPEFAAPESMPDAIAAFCERTNQPVPESDGAMLRCILESLALKYRYVYRKLGQYASQPLKGLYMLGGGSRNELLNQMTADALGVPVVTGPVEATAVGNIAVQMIAHGAIQGLGEARELIGRSFDSKTFVPSESGDFAAVAERFDALLRQADDLS